jgi:gliding motility-associated-like protein
MDSGSGFVEKAVVDPSDTTFSIGTEEVMYTQSAGGLCFYVDASETGNPYGINGVSASNKVCVELEENFVIPNIFTPDGDMKNDLFRPVITYSPSEYRLIISNRQGKTIFETDEYMESWDGTDNGQPVNEGVYLWFIRITTPSGKSISRTGTITVVKN